METTINRGGISELSIIRMSNASELLMLDKNTVYKPTPENGYLWENIEFTEIKKFEHPATVGNSGRIVAFSANLIHAGYDEIKEDTLNTYRDRPLYLFYRTLNNQLHIVENVWMSFSRLIEPATNTVTGYDILFKTELPHDIYYCSTDQIVVVDPSVLWIEEFDNLDVNNCPNEWDLNVASHNYSLSTTGSNLTIGVPKIVSDAYGDFYIYKDLGSEFVGRNLRLEYSITEMELATDNTYIVVWLFATKAGSPTLQGFKRSYNGFTGIQSFELIVPSNYEKIAVRLDFSGKSIKYSHVTIDYIKLTEVL